MDLTLALKEIDEKAIEYDQFAKLKKEQRDNTYQEQLETAVQKEKVKYRARLVDLREKIEIETQTEIITLQNKYEQTKLDLENTYKKNRDQEIEKIYNTILYN